MREKEPTRRRPAARRVGAWIVLLAVAVLVPVPPAWSDVIELKNGQRIEGTLQQASPGAGVTISTGERTLTVDYGSVSAIFLGTRPAAARLAAAREALLALGAVHSATMGNVTYREYVAAVGTAMARVDPYLREPERGDGDLKAMIADIAGLFVLAERAWRNVAVERNYAALGRDAMVARCPRLARLIAESRDTEAYLWGAGTDPASTAGIVIATRGIPAIWACTSERLAATHQLIETRHWRAPGAEK